MVSSSEFICRRSQLLLGKKTTFQLAKQNSYCTDAVGGKRKRLPYSKLHARAERPGNGVGKNTAVARKREIRRTLDQVKLSDYKTWCYHALGSSGVLFTMSYGCFSRCLSSGFRT